MFAYSYTQQVVKKDTATGNVLSDETYVYTVTWQDADIATYNAGQVTRDAAVYDALAARRVAADKASTDYAVTAEATAQKANMPALAKISGDANALALSAMFDARRDADAAATAEASKAAIEALMAQSEGPRYIDGPGAYAIDPNGSMLSLDASNFVYRDGRPMKKGDGTRLAAGLVVVAGKAIYARGLTVPSWWQWATTMWVGPITDGDPNLLPAA
jgi:hypothetical protein